MPFPANLFPAILDTVLARLALLFLTGAAGDETVARQAAARMLATYNPETEEQLHLAAGIISFSLHALEALSHAASPDLPLTKVLRLRGSAVSLSRESHKCQRKLDRLQKARPAVQPSATPLVEPAPVRPQVENALALIEAARQAKPAGHNQQTWTQAYQQRQSAKRIAENLKKSQLSHSAAAADFQAAAQTA